MLSFTIKAVLLFVIGCGFQLIILKYLRRESIFQSIYSLTPDSHKSKSSTPSFGGVGLFLTISFGVVVFQLYSMAVLWVYSVFTLFFVIGLLDDVLSMMKKDNKGFSVRQKFTFQLMGASFFLVAFHIIISPLSLSLFFVFMFLIVGSSNATNLTDGVDGLLSCLSVITLGGFAFLFYDVNLQLFFLCVVVGLALISFLIFNFFPAKLFMGDTGSLALGALFGAFTVILNNPWPLLAFGGVFVVETLSVIIQVISFKCTGKRVFLMSPLHHHFELLGFSERQIVALFCAVSLIFTGVYVL
ncbi:phospho-N-acetylmuramoyl-pentapeptide-transferase [Candidatus Marinamargulisbacteria bacterium SCGC AAA071-K20]|nr:phospho-N-acetylmuramoyl-pentapeptide-transferase [Candidatus Marinamargulisbacteria bacterium SCGC AAA071-K20]